MNSMLQLLMAKKRNSSASWQFWDGADVTKLNDVDFICAFDGGASENETGLSPLGTLSGANLVLTQGGSVAAASGGYRQIDGSDDYFSWTPGGWDSLLLGRNSWTLVWKLKDLQQKASNYCCQCHDGGSCQLYWWFNAGPTLGFYMASDAGAILNGTVTTNPSDSIELYVAVWSDGTYIRGGWTTTLPTKWSDFGANNRVSGNGSGACTYSMSNRYDVVGSHSAASGDPQYKIAWLMAARSCKINNAA